MRGADAAARLRDAQEPGARPALRRDGGALGSGAMFTIEHDFDATVITLVDEGPPPRPEGARAPLKEDVAVSAFDDCVTLRQYDARTDSEAVVTLSLTQVRDLFAAIELPEGVYRLRPKGPR